MKRISIVLVLFLGILSSCSEEFLETKPTNQIATEDVFTTVEGCEAVINGVLRNMRVSSDDRHDQFGVKAIDLVYDLMGEDMVQLEHHWFGFDYNIDNRSATYARPSFIWRQFYGIINNMNNVLANIDDTEAATEAHRANVKAQALALRGYAYHNLIEAFQLAYTVNPNAPGVPIYTEPTTIETEGKPRGTVQDVYDQIIDDLDAAIILFDNASGRKHISHINKAVAQGLRARVALYMEDWATARDMANAARTNYSLNSRAQFANGFDNSNLMVWMWGLEINDEQSTIYASLFAHLDMTIDGYASYAPKVMNSDLYNQMKDGDIRKELVGTRQIPYGDIEDYVNIKFNSGRSGGKEFSADYVMMRAEEMLLIEAEARANLDDYTGAKLLLQELRDARYDVSEDVPEADADLLDAILLERRIELWGEGFRTRDIRRLQLPLVRTGNHRVPANLPANSPRLIYQIPQREIDNNPNINASDQNI